MNHPFYRNISSIRDITRETETDRQRYRHTEIQTKREIEKIHLPFFILTITWFLYLKVIQKISKFAENFERQTKIKTKRET